MNTRYILIGIAVSAVVTFALRALPFVIFGGKKTDAGDAGKAR